MTDEQENARWQELAKQLGLDGSPPVNDGQSTETSTPVSGEQSEIEAQSSEPREGERPKRRRGRHGRNKTADDDATERTARGEAPERGRGRRKGRRKSSTPADDDAVEVSPSTVHEPADDDDEETAKLSEWNVPTWTELIDSLYRPDR